VVVLSVPNLGHVVKALNVKDVDVGKKRKRGKMTKNEGLGRDLMGDYDAEEWPWKNWGGWKEEWWVWRWGDGARLDEKENCQETTELTTEFIWRIGSSGHGDLYREGTISWWRRVGRFFIIGEATKRWERSKVE
jgi:hypothetical protein